MMALVGSVLVCLLGTFITSFSETGKNPVSIKRALRQSQGGETPLYAAAKNQHAGVVTEMLEYMNLENASVAARNGYDPLHVATEQGHLGLPGMVQVLHSAAGTGALGGCEVPPEQDPGTGFGTNKKNQPHMAVKE